METNVLEMLAHIQQSCPLLRTFTFCIAGSRFYAARALSDSVCGWSQLQNYQTPYISISPDALKHLASLPSLHTLNALIETPFDSLDDHLIPSWYNISPGFLHLRSLVAITARAAVCINLLDAIQSCTLNHIKLVVSRHTPSAEIGNLCVALGRHPSSAVIANLSIRFDSSLNICVEPRQGASKPQRYALPRFPTRRVHSSLPSSALSPLCYLKSLQNVYLLGFCFASLDDPTAAQMAMAWPQLRVADLCHDSTNSALTLAGLAPFAQCEHLEYLSVPLCDVDEQAVAAAMALKPGKLFTPSLEVGGRCPLMVLNVSRGWIREESTVGATAALSAWFPELHMVTYEGSIGRGRVSSVGHNPLEAVQCRWNAVGYGISFWVKIREQEQRWHSRRKLASQG